MSYGFEIEIDQAVLDNLEKIDNSIAKIATTSRETADKVNTQFTAMATGGIENFLSALNKVNTNINTTGLSNFTASLQGVDRGIDNTTTMTSELVRTISLLNNRIQDLQKPLPNATLIDISKTHEDLEELGFDLDGLRQQMTALKRMRTENKNFLFDETQKENAKILTAEIRTLGKEIDKLSLAEKAMKKFNSAMALGEATVTQRTRKIQRLSEVQKILNTDSNKYEKELNEIRLAQERLNKAQNESLAGVEKVRKSQSQLLNTTQQLARQAALYFSVSQIQGYIQKLAQVRGQFELQQKSLQAIMQDKEQADRVFAQVVDLSVRSPFRLSELVSYTKQLAAYRVENEKVFDVTKMLADVSAGLGVDMSRLILAYGQVKAANYLRGTELRQFSEAGINILGELRQYFAETRGEMYSTAEVFEMVSKRMISFGDVEQVFQRLTSAGGIFYNMQEIQAETLVGQISNLGDAIDVMLNKIGQSNEGALKGGISAVRTIVENYQYLEIALKAILISFGTYTSMVALATLRNRGFASSSIEATIAQGGLAKGLARTVAGFRSFGSFLKANPIMLAITGIATAAMFVKKRFDDLEESAKFYDVLTKSVQKSRTEHDKLVKSVEANNKAIKESEDIISNSVEGTKEYADAENKANVARESQVALLEELKNKFPDIYNGLVSQKNGVIDLTEAQILLNEQLRQTNTLNYLFSETGSFWKRDINEIIKDLQDIEIESRLAVGRVNSAYDVAIGNINELLDSNAEFSDRFKSQIKSIIDTSDDSITKINKLRFLFTQEAGGNVNWWNRYILDDVNKLGFEAVYKASENAEKSMGVLGSRYLEQIELLKSLNPLIDSYRKTLDLTTEEGKKQATSAILSVINSLNIQEKAVRDLIAKQFEIKLGVKLSFDGTTEELDITFLQKQINKYVETNDIVLSAELKFKEDDTAETYFSRVLSSIKELRAEEENLSLASEQLYEDLGNKEKAVQIKAQADALESFATAFGFVINETKKSSNVGKTQIETQIELLKTLNTEYEKQRKYLNEAEAKQKILKDFAEAIKDTELSGIITTDDTFDAEGVNDIFDRLQGEIAKQTPKIQLALNKIIGEIRGDINIRTHLTNIDSIKNELDTLFDAYEITLDLSAKGIDPETISRIFGFETLSLDGLEDEIERVYSKFSRDGVIDTSLMSDVMREQYEKTLQNLSDLQEKELKKSIDKFIDILSEAQPQIDRITAEQNFFSAQALKMLQEGKITAEEYATIITDLINSTSKKTSEINLELFKKSPEYIKAMGDMSIYSKKEIEGMIDAVQKLISESGSSLGAEELEVYMNAIDKMQDSINDKRFFDNPIRQIKDILYLEKEINEEKEKQIKLVQDLKKAEGQRQLAIENQAKIESEKQNIISSEGQEAYNQQSKDASVNIINATKNLDLANLKMANSQSKLSSMSSQMGNMTQGMGSAISMIDMIITGIYNAINAVIEGFEEAKELADSFGVDTEQGNWAKASAIMDGVGEMNENVMSAWERLKSGDLLGSTVSSLAVITDIIKFFNTFADRDIEEQIQKQIERIEELEYSYSKLSDTMDNATSLNKWIELSKEQDKILKQQEEAIRKAIALEEDKKNSDKDTLKEYNEQLDQIYQDQIDRQNEYLENIGGIGADNYRSMTEEFISAWEEAFLEVGEGTDVIEEKLEELVMNMIRSKAMSQFADAMLSDFYEQINKAAEGGLTPAEMDKLMDEIAVLAPELNEALKALYEQFGIVGGATSDLSEIQKGIQSITEPTGQALESLLNSTRFEVYQQTGIQREIASSLLAIKLLMSIESPIHRELVNQTSLLTNIRDDIRSIIKQGGANGAYIQTNL